MVEKMIFYENVTAFLALFALGCAALDASLLLRAPVRSALRRRAGRAVRWAAFGAACVTAKALLGAAAWAYDGAAGWAAAEPDGGAAGIAAAAESGIAVLAWSVFAAGTVAAVRYAAPRLTAISHYQYDDCLSERAAASDPRAVVPLQGAAAGAAAMLAAALAEAAVLLIAAAGLALLAALWQAQKRRHAAVASGKWTRAKPERLSMRNGNAA